MGWKPSYIRGRRRQGLGLLLSWAAAWSDLVELEIVPIVDGQISVAEALVDVT